MVAARALESRAQFGIDPIKAGRDHHVHIGGSGCAPDRQDGRTKREEPSNERSWFHKLLQSNIRNLFRRINHNSLAKARNSKWWHTASVPSTDRFRFRNGDEGSDPSSPSATPLDNHTCSGIGVFGIAELTVCTYLDRIRCPGRQTVDRNGAWPSGPSASTMPRVLR